MSLLGLRLRRRVQVEEVQEEATPEPAAPAGPSLVLLAPTVAGVGCFHALSFPDADTAAAFAAENFTSFQRGNIYAFWALQHKPAAPAPGRPEVRGEVLVLIREAEGSDIVYAVSFVDFAAADAFVRFEAKRGLPLALVSIYWAALVNIEEAPHRVRLSPEAPPHPHSRSLRPGAPAHPAGRVREIEQLAERAAERTPVMPLRTEVRAEVEAVLGAHHLEDAGGSALVDWPETDSPAADELKTDGGALQMDAPEAQLPPAIEASGPPLVEERPAPTGALPAIEDEPPQAPATIAGGEETAVVPEQVLAQEMSALAEPSLGQAQCDDWEGDVPPDPEEPDMFDVALEAAKTLRMRRWQQKEEPFRGFHSPPGRF